ALFVGPHRNHYYFGDYFAEPYAKRGFVAWMDYRPTKHSYDPCYVYYRAGYRGDSPWDRNLRELYRGRVAGEVPRPPRTFVEQERVVRELNVNRTANVNIINNVNITKV